MTTVVAADRATRQEVRMITGTVWGITLLIAGLIATIAATQVLFGALFPTGMAATRRALRAWPVASVLAGLAALAVLVLVLILLTMGLQKIGLEVVGAVLIATVSLFLLFGLGAVASEVGERLPSGAAAASGRITRAVRAAFWRTNCFARSSAVIWGPLCRGDP